MKALTICNPYPYLILSGEKKVENRTWRTPHRGAIYLHAGKSEQWWDKERDPQRFPNAAWGAVVGIVELVDCVHVRDIELDYYKNKYPWLATHGHVSGPYCWILESPQAIGPWPWKGEQGLFEIDSEELGQVANRELGIATI